MKRKVEILAPAGSWECLKAAVSAGADAVYIGGNRFGARAYANNLDEEQMLEAIDYVHLHDRKLYMTVNTLLKDREMEELYDYLLPYYRQGLDAVIVQDLGVMHFIREHFPNLPLHVSTQATVTQADGAQFYKKLGAERIVPARELSLKEVQHMKEQTGLEIECFVHGALCYCYSGQCLMSSMIGGRSGNRGQCAQPCRLPYSVAGKKPQDLLSLKDLCTIEMIPDLVDAGIDSFKIEGRMKQPEYVYTVANLYRKYTDLYLEEGRAGYKVQKEDIRLLESVYQRRGYCDGYYKKQNGKDMISLKRPDGEKEILKEKKEYKIQEKINGKLILSEGECAKLSLDWTGYGKARAVEVTGEVVQTAQKQPLDSERVEKQMRKTGNTEFSFDKLNVEIKGNVFLPMQALNEMRRVGIASLEENIIKSYRREDERAGTQDESAVYEKEASASLEQGKKSDTVEGKLRLEVSVQTVEQLRTAFNNPEVSVIYVDGEKAVEEPFLELVRKFRCEERKIYLTMPYIFREKSMRNYGKLYDQFVDEYDGVLIRNWESYQWLMKKGYSKTIISDYNMYMFNQWSKKALRATEISGNTSSVELNYQELKRLGGGDILIVYGYQPVMITANCISRTTEGCSGKENIRYLTDRYKKEFAVKNCCRNCYNIIYNSSPLVLLDQKEEIWSIHPAGLRLDFTVEKETEMKDIIDRYIAVFLKDKDVPALDMDFTRGHFKRGVK